MNDETKFTWSRIGLAFPEWKNGITEKEYNLCFPKTPKYQGEKINSSIENYGLEITLAQEFPKWINEDKKMIEKIYRDLSEKVYKEVLHEFNKSLPIFESWRKFIQKHNERE